MIVPGQGIYGLLDSLDVYLEPRPALLIKQHGFQELHG